VCVCVCMCVCVYLLHYDTHVVSRHQLCVCVFARVCEREREFVCVREYVRVYVCVCVAV